jgi:SpoIID/LytB domain protein
MIRAEPLIQVGVIENRPEIRGAFPQARMVNGGEKVEGEFTVIRGGDGLELTTQSGRKIREKDFRTAADEGGFLLHGVTIGIQFHWERTEDESFHGGLRLVPDGNGITAINEIGLEDYLKSVISSEMSAESPPELLKAHAVTSRSWLAAMLEQQSKLKNLQKAARSRESSEELIRWYDREDHALFNVCADDHCQRYQGVSKIITAEAERAVEATRGMFLIYGGEICDARFSKACGGISENFESAWDDLSVPYLHSITDSEQSFRAVANEKEALAWIKSRPAANCNTSDKEILKRILPSFDRETSDFFRWEASYSQPELSELIRKKSGVDFGSILDLIPIQRGPSGRIVRLRIVGSKKTLVVGKELEIRKWLSPSHLYSSAFVVSKSDGRIPASFTLYGAGWGHGVGLCQIGAAVMATKGKKAEEILLHYFRGAEVTKVY